MIKQHLIWQINPLSKVHSAILIGRYKMGSQQFLWHSGKTRSEAEKPEKKSEAEMMQSVTGVPKHRPA